MMTIILVLFGLIWIAVGAVLTVGTMEELIANRPARQAWRMERMDRVHADAYTDFFRSGVGILWVVLVVMLGWPVFLWQTIRGHHAHQ